jgi:hypothetical protein
MLKYSLPSLGVDRRFWGKLIQKSEYENVFEDEVQFI